MHRVTLGQLTLAKWCVGGGDADGMTGLSAANTRKMVWGDGNVQSHSVTNTRKMVCGGFIMKIRPIQGTSNPGTGNITGRTHRDSVNAVRSLEPFPAFGEGYRLFPLFSNQFDTREKSQSEL